jgi:hypothetical protein
MSSMETARTTTLAVKKTVQAASAFFFARDTIERGTEAGLEGVTFYVAGRGGVLGDVPDAEVVAAFHHFTPETLLIMWETAGKVASPAELGAMYAECVQAWGRAHLADLPGVARLAEVTTRIIRANDLGAMAPLYSGWRAVPLPDDAPARLAQNMQTLREHRGGVHILALTAHRLAPLEAQLAEGSPYIAFYGRTGPFPEVTPDIRARYAASEALTDELVAAAYSVLDDDESADFAAAAEALGACFAH